MGNPLAGGYRTMALTPTELLSCWVAELWADAVCQRLPYDGPDTHWAAELLSRWMLSWRRMPAATVRWPWHPLSCWVAESLSSELTPCASVIMALGLWW